MDMDVLVHTIHGSITERVISLISKDTIHRNDRDIDMVLPWLRKKSDVLQGLEPDVLKDVIRHCSYRKSSVDDVLIRQGDVGDSFFIMLSGRTSVYIDTVRSDDDGRTPFPPENEKSNTEGAEELHSRGRKRKPLDRSKYGKFIMRFDSGKSFGEIALISEDAVRNATIITDEDTDLLVISRDLFNRSIKSKQEEEYRVRKTFVDECPIFSHWSPKMKRLCEMSLRKETHQYGSVIAGQGQPTVGLVFIYSGQAKLVLETSKHTTQYPKLMQHRLSTIYNLNKSINPDGTVNKDSVTCDQIRVRRKQGYVAAEKRIMSRYTNLCCIEEGEVAGDTEMVLDLDTNLGSLISIADTAVFVLNPKNYERLVQRKHPHTAEILKTEVYQKLCGRLSTTVGAQIPLLKKLQGVLGEMIPNANQQYKKTDNSLRKSGMMYLIDMFLEDKTPLIPPYVQDSLYYRKRSSEKAAKIITNAKIKKGRDIRRERKKMPRSLEKLKNNPEAERELLGYRPLSVGSGEIRRPSSGLMAKGGSVRPTTATESVTITRCEVDHDFGQPTRRDEVPDRDLVVEIFEEMELYQREKTDERSRLLCSGRNLKEEVEEDPVFDELLVENYFDWETSDNNLCDLEKRIKNFCANGNQESSRDKNFISEMRRFELEHPQYVPIPGGSVFVHKKPCRFPPNTPVSPSIHQHVRRYMLSRQRQHAGTNTVCYS